MWRGVALGGRRLPSFSPPAFPRVSPSIRTVRVATVGAALSFVLATTLGVTGFVAQRGSIAFGATTTLTIVGGDVAVSDDGVTFQSASDGDALRAGTTIRTSASGYAVITYFDGSTVSVDPDTTLTIAALGLDPDGTTTIRVRQDIGRTWHSVQRLLSGSSRYEVTTPTMTATVRGTMFAIGVSTDPEGQAVTTLDTVEGVVAASKPTAPGQPFQEVLVRAGFRATGATSGPIGPPVPSPEPERTITVTIGASAGVVVDSVGRANGIVDGKVVAHTPLARVERRGGELIVKLPDIPDGKIVAVVRSERARSGAVGLFTDVQDKRGVPLSARQRVPADGGGLAVASVEIRHGEPPAIATPASDDERSALAASVKGADAKRDDGRAKKDDEAGGSGSGGGGGFAPSGQLPSLPLSGSSVVGDRAGSGYAPGDRLPALPFGGARRDPEQTEGSRDTPATQSEPAAQRGSEGSKPGDRSGGGFVPSAPLPDLPSLPKPETDTTKETDTKTGTDTKNGSDRGGGKPDTKGKP